MACPTKTRQCTTCKPASSRTVIVRLSIVTVTRVTNSSRAWLRTRMSNMHNLTISWRLSCRHQAQDRQELLSAGREGPGHPYAVAEEASRNGQPCEDWRLTKDEMHTFGGLTKCPALRRGEEAALMKVGTAGDERPGRRLESAFFDWPSRTTHWEHFRQAGRLSAAESALHGSEQYCHCC